jgi:hypothetical protein
MEELKHHGIKGMKWGVRRSKAQLARLTGRKESNISDEEATEFAKDVKYLTKHRGQYKARKKVRNEAMERRGKEYTDAVFAQARKSGSVKTATNLAVQEAGKRYLQSYIKKAMEKED